MLNTQSQEDHKSGGIQTEPEGFQRMPERRNTRLFDVINASEHGAGRRKFENEEHFNNFIDESTKKLQREVGLYIFLAIVVVGIIFGGFYDYIRI